jgi:hypothetical protein
MVLSVNDIQGLWREQDTKSAWEVTGIVAEKAHRPKGQKKSPIVLGDGPEGVMWGKGNLKGSMEDGVLVWRNRRGEAAYCWEKLVSKAEVMQTTQKTGAEEVKQSALIYSTPQASRKNSIDKLTPRSTSSGMSNETAEITPGMGSPVMLASDVDQQPNDAAVAEMQMLMEMARNRLMAGDVYMSMRYITLAQEVQPLMPSIGHSDHM